MPRKPKPPNGYATIGIGDASNAVLTPAPRIMASIYQEPSREQRGKRRRKGTDPGNIHTLMPTPSDVVLFNSDVLPVNIITDLFFENIGGQEILTVARHDTVNGRPVLYQPIKNISKLALAFNSLNIVPTDSPATTIFANYKLKFENYIPDVGSGPNGEYVYVDSSGSVIIDVVNISNTENVQVDIVSDSRKYLDTDYSDGGIS